MEDTLLKELNLFTIDNEYRVKMLDLIEKNQSAPKKKVPGRELHHICPKFYWKYFGKVVSNEGWNLVSFSGADHLLCHYYLYECVIPELKSKAIAPINILKRYLHKKFLVNEENILALKDVIDVKGGAALGTKWYHNPETGETLMSKKCPKGFVEGRGVLKPDGPTQKRKREHKAMVSKCLDSSNLSNEIRLRNRLEDEGCCEEAIDWFMEEFFYDPRFSSCHNKLKFALFTIDLMGLGLECGFEKLSLAIEKCYGSRDLWNDPKYYAKLCWYNNGLVNTRLSLSDIELKKIPEGFYPGRDFSLPSVKLETLSV